MITRTSLPVVQFIVLFLILFPLSLSAQEFNAVTWNSLVGIQLESEYLVPNHSFSISKATGQQIIKPNGSGSIVFYPEKNEGKKFLSLCSVTNTAKDYGDFTFLLNGGKLSILVIYKTTLLIRYTGL